MVRLVFGRTPPYYLCTGTMSTMLVLYLYYAYYACAMPTMPIYNHPSILVLILAKCQQLSANK